MKSHYKPLGRYIREVKVKNVDLQAKELLGINIDKFFMPSVANVVGTDLSNYKIVKRNQFACNRMHVGRDYRIPVALSHKDEPFMVSPAYDVFEIKDTSVLMPEYLMMWFSRKEFDRNAWFHTDADVRGGLPWKAFCEMQLPVPSIEKQREIVAEYNTVQNRIVLNSQLIQKLEATAQALYKHWFVDFEFPDENGNPYKSSGGEMVESELGEIPKEWVLGTLENIYQFQYGLGNTNPDNNGPYPVYGSNGIIGGFDKYNNEDAPVIGHIGANCGSVVFAFGKHFVTYNGVMCLIKDKSEKWFGYNTLLIKDLMSQTRGSSQPFVSYDMLYELQVVLPTKRISYKYNEICAKIYSNINISLREVVKLEGFKDLLLSKIATIETAKPELATV